MYSRFVEGDILHKSHNDFLLLLKHHIDGKHLPDDFDASKIFELAEKHNVLPIVYAETKIIGCEVNSVASRALRHYGMQVKKNVEFNSLYIKLKNAGVNPIVVKGVVCSGCYPVPDYRIFSDVDLIVDENEKQIVDDCLFSEGFAINGDNYVNYHTGLNIEITYRRQLADELLSAIVEKHFPDWQNNLVVTDGYLTLSPTHHFAYLIYHAFAHFIASGFGVRQLLDIVLFAKKYYECIDFAKIISVSDDFGFLSFVENLFFAAENVFDCKLFNAYFDKNSEKLCYDLFIDDIMASGLFGNCDEDRLHSAAITSQAVNNSSSGAFSAVFPPYSVMKDKYKCLNKYKFLLPLFWVVRIIVYLFSVFRRKNVSPINSINIARDRMKIMQIMGIINSER